MKEDILSIEKNTSITCIESVDEFLNIIFKKYSKLKPNAFYEKQRVFFRGQNKESYDLTTSLRRPISKSGETFERFELDMINTAKLQNPEEFNSDNYPVNMLARMQHFGLPTRLLDITENALVALYFSCKGEYKQNGKVFCFLKEKDDIHTAYSVYANLIACQFHYSKFSYMSFSEFWELHKFEKFIPPVYQNRSWNDVKEQITNVLSEPIFVLPEMITEREKRQLAAFILFPNIIDEDISGFNNKLAYSNKLPDFELQVDAKKKKKILNQLEMLGITEQFLFPETDKKCLAIKEQTKFLLNYEEDELDN